MQLLPRSAPPRLINVYVDFDGTIAPDEPTDQLFERFADPGWGKIACNFTFLPYGRGTLLGRPGIPTRWNTFFGDAPRFMDCYRAIGMQRRSVFSSTH